MDTQGQGEEILMLDYPDAELVFGIVCAVGTDYRPVVDYLKNLLKRARYKTSELHVSEYFPEVAQKLGLGLDFHESDEYARIDSRMKAGNAIREKTGDAAFSALDIASRIYSTRSGVEGDEPEALPNTAHIIISLKREEEVRLLRKIYGPGFFLIGIFSSEQERRDYLETEKGVYGDPLSDLIERDQKDKDEFGQRTRDTFEHADVFVALKNDQYKKGVRRFLQLVFGFPYDTPSRDEYGMFFAYCSSTRSGALARQVGAAILSPEGDLIAVGCNDVPSPRGGLYWGEDKLDQRDHQQGGDSNDKQKEKIVEAAAEKFTKLAESASIDEAAHRMLRDKNTLDLLRTAVSSAISDVTEFGRSVHAEMDAITTCARRGVEVAGCTLFTTTFPCHNCTRHLVAAGIKRVVYIEPYPKSKAGMLHGDAICSADEEQGENSEKIPFAPFVGIGPRRFFDLFSMNLSAGYPIDRKLDGDVIDWKLETQAKPRVPMPPTSYIHREQLVSKKIVLTYQEKGNQNAEGTTGNQNGRGVLAVDETNGSPRRKVASMEGGRTIRTEGRTGTSEPAPDSLFE